MACRVVPRRWQVLAGVRRIPAFPAYFLAFALFVRPHGTATSHRSEGRATAPLTPVANSQL